MNLTIFLWCAISAHVGALIMALVAQRAYRTKPMTDEELLRQYQAARETYLRPGILDRIP